MIRVGISLAIVFIMVFAFSGYYASFKWRQYHVRKEIKHLIKVGAPDSLHYDFYLDEIEKDPTQMTWIHSMEFRYRGEMYDIISRSQEGERTLLHCIHDVKESGLFAELDRMVHIQLNGDPKEHNGKQQWAKFYNSLYWASKCSLSMAYADLLSEHQSHYFDAYSFQKHAPPTPPPKILI